MHRMKNSLKVFENIILEYREYFSCQNRNTQFFAIFWLCGPLILLIERSPADLWLTVCGAGFLIHCIKQKNSAWLSFYWVKSLIVFWIVCIISALLSELPLYSFGEAFIWIRFPVFAFACCFWLGKDRRALNAMYLAVGLGMILMGLILITEFIVKEGVAGRLSWPYGDLVPGNYLAKTCMPVLCVLAASAASSRFSLSLPSFLVLSFSLLTSFLTGERVNLILRCASAALASLSWRPKFLRLALFLLFTAISLLFLNAYFPWLGVRYVADFVQELPITMNSPYLRVWLGGVEAFLTSPIIGIGPDNYRMLCASINAGISYIDCHTHPHNYFVQLAAETGLIGLFSAVVMMLAMTLKCFKFGLRNRQDVLSVSAFVVPLGFFFPLQTTADFFGQWNNIFMWTGLGLAMSVCHSKHIR